MTLQANSNGTLFLVSPSLGEGGYPLFLDELTEGHQWLELKPEEFSKIQADVNSSQGKGHLKPSGELDKAFLNDIAFCAIPGYIFFNMCKQIHLAKYTDPEGRRMVLISRFEIYSHSAHRIGLIFFQAYPQLNYWEIIGGKDVMNGKGLTEKKLIKLINPY